eukprot:TRINITY_DN102763_c0_g1_i1.p1 TRINITY_DN102763_c0_g1~~TRINITY_DN102763_c0_g1_i1.p1  ORF type:complete len:561 (+),score=64.76 TRINITY_DN102763_c0_g1_i1:84-1766(+)
MWPWKGDDKPEGVNVDRDAVQEEEEKSDLRRDSYLLRVPPRETEWFAVAQMMNTDVIGIGILTIPHSMAKLGWMWGTLALVVCFLANVFCAILMVRIHETYPRAITWADAVECVTGSRALKTAVRLILYGEKVLVLAAVLTLEARSIGALFFDQHYCLGVWCLACMFVNLPFMQLRRLAETKVLNFINILSIMFCLGIIIHKMPSSSADTSIRLPKDADVFSTASAFAHIVFAYSGNWMYFEIMAEMREPRDFPKAFLISGPIQVGLYFIIGAAGYHAYGSAVPGNIMMTVPFGDASRAVSATMITHLLCGTVVTTVVLVRFFQSRHSQDNAEANNFYSSMTWFATTLVMSAFGVLMSMSVPSFEQVVGLAGALVEPVINFVMPVLLFLTAWMNSGGAIKCPVWFWPCLIAALCTGGATFGLGLVDNTSGPSSKSERLAPFSCKCKDMWATCECSRERMPAGYCPAVPHALTEQHETVASGGSAAQLEEACSRRKSNSLQHGAVLAPGKPQEASASLGKANSPEAKMPEKTVAHAEASAKSAGMAAVAAIGPHGAMKRLF